MLHFDEKLADLIGLETSYTQNGKYEGKVNMSESRLQSRRSELNSVDVTVVNFSAFEISIDASEDNSLDSVAEVINTSLQDNSINASIVFSESDAVIVVRDKFLKLELPRSLNVALGFPVKFEYKSGRYRADIHHLHQRSSREHILLISDFVADQYYCSSLLPILKILPIGLFKGSFIVFDNSELP